jgi:hypothetical protein
MYISYICNLRYGFYTAPRPNIAAYRRLRLPTSERCALSKCTSQFSNSVQGRLFRYDPVSVAPHWPHHQECAEQDIWVTSQFFCHGRPAVSIYNRGLAISPSLAETAEALTILPSLLGHILWDSRGLWLLPQGIRCWHRVRCRLLQHRARLALLPFSCTTPTKESLPKKPDSSHEGRSRSAPRSGSYGGFRYTASPCRGFGILARTVSHVRLVNFSYDHDWSTHAIFVIDFADTT